MSFIDLVKKRKTTFEFSDKDVSEAAINKMLEAGRWAPSCTNAQPWHFIVIRDEKTIEKLMDHVTYGFFHSSPKVMIATVLIQDLCNGPNHVCFRGEDSGVHDTYMSIGIATYNMIMEARELGVDSCLLTPKQAPVKKILKVKDLDAVPLIIGLGYEDKKAFKRTRERRELKEMVSYEHYGGKKK